jgi:hypothetical protein
MPAAADYDGGFNAPILWNSNFFMTLESMKILRILADVWLPPEVRAGTMRHDAGENAVVLGNGDPQYRAAAGMG